MAIKKCVMIACVTFETAMIVEPADTYGADEVHLFHYVREPDSENGRVYTEFYDEVCEQLRNRLRNVRIVEHAKDPVYDFQKMFRDILQVVNDVRTRSRELPESGEQYIGPDSDILINASSGTSEFSAAAIIASMMSEGVSTFTVGTRDYTIKTEDIRDLYYRNDRPVGLTEHTSAPRFIPKFDIRKPEENQIRALRAYHKRFQNSKPLTASGVIQQLKDDGIWNYAASTSEHKTVMKQKETMYYQRHYLENWIRNGWVEKPAGSTKYRLTENGLIVISTFYVD